MQTHSTAPPMKMTPIARSAIPPPLEVRPVLDASAAVEALGDIEGAATRRSLPDLLAAWRAFCQAINRADLLRVDPKFPAVLIELAPGATESWAYLVSLAFAAARNLHARDAERHWQMAARTFQQAAVNAAATAGTRVAEALTTWTAADWRDEEDDAPISEFSEQLLAAGAARAAHYARIALSDGLNGFSEAQRADSRGRSAVDQSITEALINADLLVLRRMPYTEDEILPVCALCHSVEGHDRDCPLLPLSATTLLQTYRTALRGGAR